MFGAGADREHRHWLFVRGDATRALAAVDEVMAGNGWRVSEAEEPGFARSFRTNRRVLDGVLALDWDSRDDEAPLQTLAGEVAARIRDRAGTAFESRKGSEWQEWVSGQHAAAWDSVGAVTRAISQRALPRPSDQRALEAELRAILELTGDAAPHAVVLEALVRERMTVPDAIPPAPSEWRTWRKRVWNPWTGDRAREGDERFERIHRELLESRAELVLAGFGRFLMRVIPDGQLVPSFKPSAEIREALSDPSHEPQIPDPLLREAAHALLHGEDDVRLGPSMLLYRVRHPARFGVDPKTGDAFALTERVTAGIRFADETR